MSASEQTSEITMSTTREIKFRIWDGKQMQQVGVIDLDDERSMDYYNWYDGYSGENYPFERYPLMQYTGLKDKEGKEIWEGDRFQVAKNKVYTVEWTDGIESNHEWYGGCFILNDGDGRAFPFDEFAMANGAVIGNIYENPELLQP